MQSTDSKSVADHMLRRVSRWGVTALGVALVICGVVAMAGGWDIIQVERGWSLFIGGAAVLAGGAVVIALGQVALRLDEILAGNAVAPRRGKIARAFRPQPPSHNQKRRSSAQDSRRRKRPRRQGQRQRRRSRKPQRRRSRQRHRSARTPPAQQAPLAAVPAASPAPPVKEPEQKAEATAADEASGAEPREVDRYRVRRHHLRDVLGWRGGSPDIERRAAFRFPRRASRASRAAILSEG